MRNAVASLLLQVIRFSAVGVAATLAYYAAAASLGFLNFEAYGANALAYGVGAVVSFLGHFYFTFEKRADHLIHLRRFVLLMAIGFLVSNLIVLAIVDFVGASFQIAAAAIAVIVPAVTWFGGRYWAFK